MIRKLAKSLREYKKPAVLTPIIIAIEVMLEVAIPFTVSYLIDLGIKLGDMGQILKYGGILVALALASLALGILAGRLSAIASAGFAKNLRRDMYYKVQQYSFSNIDKFSTASIVTRLTTDVTNIQNSFQMMIRLMVRSPLMIAFSLIMVFRINAQISLIFLFTVPFLGAGLYLVMTKAHPIFKRAFRIYDKLNRVVQENLRGIRVVKSYVREDYEEKKFKEVSGQMFKDFSAAERTVALTGPLMQFSTYAGIVLISWFGAKLIVARTMTEGQLVSLISYSMQLLISLMMLSMVFVTLTISRASAERAVEILDEAPDITNSENPVREVKSGDIKFEDVSFSYAGNWGNFALKDINLKIKSGETVGIIGGTGSSKTTLLQLIPRLYDATRGKVLVGGRDVREYDLKALRDAVAIVLQKNVLFSGTIKENLRWGNEHATEEEMVQACRLAQAHDFIVSFPDGYDTYVEQGGTNLSGGQRQRLCIARALLKRPKILILDDSTSAVDTKTDALIRQGFKNYLPGVTKLVVTQRISSITDADKIVIMEGGTIAAMGTHEQLLNENEIYRDIYHSQQKGGVLNEA
ncbi:MAG: ABC transporter ATP-binding protein [Clostridiales bacterium]|nr:ABC transporter ATP-binding protein [Clostridiales bacterium]